MHYHAPDNEKIYCCDICNKRYSKKCQLKQHIYLIHAFPKELKCDQCNKLLVFSYKHCFVLLTVNLPFLSRLDNKDSV